MKKLLIFTLLLCCTVRALSYTERNYLQKQASVSSLQEVLILNQQWVTYPAYTDRTGWDTFLGSFKNECILRGEKQLNYQWQVVKATDSYKPKGCVKTLFATDYTDYHRLST